MRSLVRWTVGLITVVHGLIHLIGAIKAFEWAEVTQLTQPISRPLGIAWLIAAVVTTAAGVMLLAGVRRWWAVAAIAAVTSQIVIVSSWSDAWAGTLANLLLLTAAIYGFCAQGPFSFRAEYRRRSEASVRALRAAEPPTDPVVTDADLGHLPPAVAGFVRAAGTVGLPHVIGFQAEISGRIRSGPDQPWMPWSGQQVNTFGDQPSRVLFMDATMKGLPTDVLHAYIGTSATMRVRVASLLQVVDAHGPEMTQAETVTLLNDLCILAPAALVDAGIDWSEIDDNHVRAAFTNAGHTARAELTFNDAHELVDFVSDDRLVASRDGRTFTPQRWSTPIAEHRRFAGRRVGSLGYGRWHPADAPSFDYLEFHLDAITFLEPETLRHR